MRTSERIPKRGCGLIAQAAGSCFIEWLKPTLHRLTRDVRTLCIEIAKRGYRKMEPNEAPCETSQVLAKVFGALREDGVTKYDIASALNVKADDLDQLVFGLALTCLGSKSQTSSVSSRKRPHLQLLAGGKK